MAEKQNIHEKTLIIISWLQHEVTPLENAIETMENTNSKLKKLITQHTQDTSLPVNPLSLLLNGIVDAAVMGGIKNYEEVSIWTCGKKTKYYIQWLHGAADNLVFI